VSQLQETEISKTIIDAYHEKLVESIAGDVVIVGAGPSGMTAAIDLAQQGFKVAVLEKRLSPGGGVWGGGIGMNEAVVQDDVLPLLEEIGVRYKPARSGLHAVDTMELAAALCLKAVQAGAVLLNLVTVEDVCVHQQRVSGVVANRSMIAGQLPVDPIMFAAHAVVDATGHEAVVVQTLRQRGLLTDPAALASRGECPLDAAGGEAFVVENAGEVFPGLWVSGMSVCVTFGGPRMGPIFGGMLLSGRRVAELIAAAIRPPSAQSPSTGKTGPAPA